MRAMAADPRYRKSYDERGRELVDDETWRKLLTEVETIGLDAGYLASIMRMSKNDDDRRTAFYAMFYCTRVDYVFNLISHIPGEPVHVTREESLPRAVEYLRVHLGKRFGDLDDAQKQAILAEMPEPGSPARIACPMVPHPRIVNEGCAIALSCTTTVAQRLGGRTPRVRNPVGCLSASDSLALPGGSRSRSSSETSVARGTST